MATFSMSHEIPGDTVSPLNLDFARPFGPQVQEYYFNKAPDLRGYSDYGLPIQAIAAVMAVPVLEMSVGFPHVLIYNIGTKEVVGVLDLGNFRHSVVRPRRAELARGEAYPGYTVIDGAGRGGLTGEQLEQLAERIGATTTEIRVMSAPMGHMNFSDPTAGVVDALVASGLSAEDWAGGRVLYLPPGMGLSAVVQATAIYGLSEVWPRTIRLNRRPDGSFAVEELVDPQALRQFGVALRAAWIAAVPTATLSGNIPEEFRRALAELARQHGVTVQG